MAEELDLSMLPNWLRDMDDGPSVRPGADDGARYGLTWCGSFTVHGLGFQAMNGTTTDFAMAWPIGDGAWQVLQDAYDIYDPVAGQDGYIETDDLNDIMRENGFRSLNSFTAAEGEGWRESLTRAVAARWCRERYSVPLTFIDRPSLLSRLVSVLPPSTGHRTGRSLLPRSSGRWCARKTPTTWPHTPTHAYLIACSFALSQSFRKNRLDMGWEWRRKAFVASKARG